MYKNEFVFPASNTISEMSHFAIYRAVADHIFSKLPIDQFKTIILDFKNNIKDIFANQNGRLVNIKEPKTLEYPLIQIEFQNTGNNLKDTHMGINTPLPMTIYAGAEGLNGEKRGATAFYVDQNNIQMFSSDIYNRATFSVNIYVQTFDDRNNLANIIDTNLKQHYGYELDPVEVKFLFPNNLVKYLRECLFSKELEFLKENNTIISKEELEKIALDIDTKFVDYLKGFSNGTIDIFNKDDLSRNLRIYHKRYQKPFYKLDNEISLGDGEKKGEVYEKYNINFSGYIEYYNLINFILSMPSIINGEWTKTYITKNQFPDKDNNIKIQKANTFFCDTRENYKKYLRSNDKEFVELFEDVEFLCENGSDTYPFIEKFMKKYNNLDLSIISYDYNITYNEFDYHTFVNYIKNLSISEEDYYRFYPLDKILFIIPYIIEEKRDINKYFKLFIWKNDKLISEEDQYFNSDNLNIEIKNTDSNSVYSLLTMVNMNNIDLEFNKLTIYNH